MDEFGGERLGDEGLNTFNPRMNEFWMGGRNLQEIYMILCVIMKQVDRKICLFSFNVANMQQRLPSAILRVMIEERSILFPKQIAEG